MNYDLRQIARQFQIYGDFQNAQPYGTGHINDTFKAIYDQGGCSVSYIFQRINHAIFTDPVSLMNNVIRVTHHIRKKLMLSGLSDTSRHVMTVIPTWNEKHCYQDADGNYWRAYFFIEGARTYDVLETLEQAYQAAKAFGIFQSQLADLPDPPLVETIPGFHDAQKRYQTFLNVLKEGPCNRAYSAKAEMDYLNSSSGLFDVLPKLVQDGQIPVRTTHNDTKINNVMIDDVTSEGVCVIDLDTVMPGLSLYDFGDIVRTTASNSLEDEVDLSKVKAEIPRMEAVIRGYLDGAGSMLNSVETNHLIHAGKLITMIIGMRFLTDYLAGDHYFKVHRDGHNLDRCRTQFKLVRSLTEQQGILEQLVGNCMQTLS